MSSKLLICTLAFACLAGCASSSTRAPNQPAAANAVPPDCIRTTASRIPPGPHDCQNAPGRSYSREDIQDTGQTNVAGALGMLDTSVTPR